MDTDAGEEKGCQEEGKEESEEEVAFLLYPTNDGERRGTWSPGDIHQTIRSWYSGRFSIDVDGLSNRKDGDHNHASQKESPGQEGQEGHEEEITMLHRSVFRLQ